MMKKNVVKNILSIVIATTMACTSFVPSYAAEDFVMEDIIEETAEGSKEELTKETTEELTEEVTTEVTEEITEEAAAEPAKESASREELFSEELTEGGDISENTADSEDLLEDTDASLSEDANAEEDTLSSQTAIPDGAKIYIKFDSASMNHGSARHSVWIPAGETTPGYYETSSYTGNDAFIVNNTYNAPVLNIGVEDINRTYNSEFVLTPNYGYYLKGLKYAVNGNKHSLDQDTSSYSYHTKLTLDMLTARSGEENAYEITLYPEWEVVKVQLRINRTGDSWTSTVLDTTVAFGDEIPTPDPLRTRLGYTFSHYEYIDSQSENYERKELTKGKKFDESVKYRSPNGGTGYYILDLYEYWDPDEFTITYHLDKSNDEIKYTETYNTSNSTGYSLDLKTALSENSGFKSSSASSKTDFAGWAVTKDGPVLFDSSRKADAARKWAENNKGLFKNGNKNIDLYAVWNYAQYTVNYHALDGVVEAADAYEAFTGSDFRVSANSDLIHTEKVDLTEKVILSGKEFARAGYKLTGWKYTVKDDKGNDVKKTLKSTGSFKSIAAADGTVDLYAVWQKVASYTITLDAKGGTIPGKIKKITYNVNNTTDKKDLPIPQKKGYSFGGWTANGVTYEYYGKDVFKNLKLTAKWTAITYTVKLSAGEGLIGEANTADIANISYGKTIDLSKYKAKRNGYKLSGWKLVNEQTGSSKTYKTNAKVKNLATTDHELVTLSAVWKSNSYTITYKYNGGALKKGTKNPKKYSAGTAKTLNIPVKAGYAFEGYVLSQKGVLAGDETAALDDNNAISAASYGNVILTAKWKPLTYSIKVVATFADEDEASDNTVLTGLSYNDKFRFADAAKAVDSSKDSSITGIAVTKTGAKKFELNKYYKVSELVKATGASKTEDGTEIVVYGIVNKNEKHFYINYTGLKDGADTSALAFSYKPGKKTNLTAAKAAGWKFLGFTATANAEYFEADKNGYVTAIKTTATGNLELTANYEAVKYTITLNPNGAGVKQGETSITGPIKWKVGETDVTADYSGAATPEVTVADLPTWTRKGYDFAGWGTTAKAKEADRITSLAKLSGSENATIYAIWKPKTFNIIYDEFFEIDGETYSYSYIPVTLPDNTTQTYGNAFTPKKVSAKGYTFKGWKVDSKNDVTFTDSYVKSINATNTEDKHLTAAFTANRHTYKLMLQGGSAQQYRNNKYYTVKGTVTVAKDVKTGDSNKLQNALYNISGMKRSGYQYVGIATDKNGKHMLDRYNYYQISKLVDSNASKSGTSVTLYAIWKKIPKLSTPANITASVTTDGYLTVNIKDKTPEGANYKVELCYDEKFSKDNTIEKTVYASTGRLFGSDYTASRYYIRVRQYAQDSTGKITYGKYSKVMRVTKTGTAYNN